MINSVPNVDMNNIDNEEISNPYQQRNKQCTQLYSNDSGTIHPPTWTESRHWMKQTTGVLSSRGTVSAEAIPPPELADNPRRLVTSLVSGTHKRFTPRSPGFSLPSPQSSRGPVSADVKLSPELTENPRPSGDGRRGTDKGSYTHSPGWIGRRHRNDFGGKKDTEKLNNNLNHPARTSKNNKISPGTSAATPSSVTHTPISAPPGKALLEQAGVPSALPSSAFTNADEYDRLQQDTLGPEWSNKPTHSTNNGTVDQVRSKRIPNSIGRPTHLTNGSTTIAIQ